MTGSSGGNWKPLKPAGEPAEARSSASNPTQPASTNPKPRATMPLNRVSRTERLHGIKTSNRGSNRELNVEPNRGSGSPYSTPPPPPPPEDNRTERLHRTQGGRGGSDTANGGGSFVGSVGAGTGGSNLKGKMSWGKRIGISVLICFLVSVILGAAGFVWMYSRITVPEPSEVALAQTTTVYFGDGETEMGEFAEVNRRIIDVSNLPTYVSEAIVASEDRTFYTNAGVDVKGIARALWNNLRGGARQGASTLTQQYVESYFGQETYGYLDKLREAITALKINREQSKNTILFNYMNTIYFGRGAYGIEAASEAYFDKPAKELTLSEAAMLAGIIPAPSIGDPAIDLDMAQDRWKRVLTLMVEDGWISSLDAQTQVFPETVEQSQSVSSMTGWKGYLLQQIRDELVNNGEFTAEDISAGGFTIVTTIDPKMQEAAVDALSVMPDDTPDSVRTAISTVDNETGEILAEYAGSDYQEIQINAVTQDIAMAGSTFKPFALIPYLENGGNMYDKFDGNSPLKMSDVVVNNSGNKSWGRVTAKMALENSINTAFAQINEKVGGQATMDTLIEAGIPADTPGLEATTLNVFGSASPHNIDLTCAFATLANGGERITPHIVKEVRTADANVIYRAVTAKEEVFDSETIAKIMPAMEAVPRNVAPSYRGRFLNGHPVAGKTGTAEDFKAAQFSAFIPQLTTTVSMYNVGEGGASLELPGIGGRNSFYGGEWPAEVWFAFMNAVTADLPVETFSWYQTETVTREKQPAPTPTEPTEPTPTPDPEPAPKEPDPVPDPEPKPDPEPVPVPEPDPEPTPDPEPEET